MNLRAQTKEPFSGGAREKKVVVIVGGGFAGLSAANSFSGQEDVDVILIDQRNYHLFQPLLYQVATAELSPSNIAVPIRTQFSDSPNVEVHMGKVDAVDLKNKSIRLGSFSFQYDYLILACGVQHSYFGKPEWEEHAPGLKTLEQATEIRRRLLLAFEEAENELDPRIQEELLTFAIVGGGATGVELAGAIADISRKVFVKDFKRIDASKARVLLLEAGPRILTAFSKELSERATRDLQSLGVEVRCGARVEAIDKTCIRIGDEIIPTHSVFWAAGVQASQMQFSEAVETDHAGRIKVSENFSVPGWSDVFVIGDMCLKEHDKGKYLPGLAPVAKQSGHYVAQAILNSIRGKPVRTFQYVDKGIMATIGRKKAIAQTKSLKMTGTLAWFAWLFIHVLYLIGFKNRFTVVTEWVWSYLFSKRSARLIIEKRWKLDSSE